MALDPLTAILNATGKIFDRVVPDPNQRAAAQLEIYKLQQAGDLAEIMGQLEINKEEAKHSSIFVSGWRPFIGWTCGAAFGWNWIGLPVANLALALMKNPLALQPADLSEMMPVLLGMLGLGAMRTAEKFKGVTK